MRDLELYIFGSTKSKRALAEKFASAAKQVLFPRMENVVVNIELYKNLLEDEGVCGDVMHEDDREFTIRLDSSMTKEDFATTLCHEMIHVRQYCRKELSQPTGRTMIWKKEVFPTDLDYHLRPWETEAHSLESEIYNRCDNIVTA
ncbi:hypothetical protein EB151_04250 [archaeon]|nr:hypothetical protein [archaeon]